MGDPSFVQPFSVRCPCFAGNPQVVVERRNGRLFRARAVRRRHSYIAPISAVQVNTVSGDHDGEVGENELKKVRLYWYSYKQPGLLRLNERLTQLT